MVSGRSARDRGSTSQPAASEAGIRNYTDGAGLGGGGYRFAGWWAIRRKRVCGPGDPTSQAIKLMSSAFIAEISRVAAMGTWCGCWKPAPKSAVRARQTSLLGWPLHG